MTKNRTPTPVYLDPGMHSCLEVKGLNIMINILNIKSYLTPAFLIPTSMFSFVIHLSFILIIQFYKLKPYQWPLKVCVFLTRSFLLTGKSCVHAIWRFNDLAIC